MCDNFPYPAWLEAHAINDEDVAAAYESLAAQDRANLKATIAALYRIYGENPHLWEQTRVLSPTFAVHKEMSAAPFVIYFIEADYRYPACLLAAVMPAILAGVKRILPCFVPAASGSDQKTTPAPTADQIHKVRQAAAAPGDSEGSLPSTHLLAALDLAGIERCFAVTDEALKDLLSQMTQALGPGRLVRIGQNRLGDTLALKALHLRIPCMDLSGHPGFLSRQKTNDPPLTQGDRQAAATLPNLALDKNYENIWLWPELNPNWFHTKRMHIFHP